MLLRAFVAAVALTAVSASPAFDKRQSSSKPNFVFIITDDQDAGTATPEIMPLLTKRFASGANYSSFYTPLSQCCPSRVTFLRGQHPHTHNVTDVSLPFGGWEVFNSYGYNGKWLPSWLQAAGYRTFYTGKLMNGHTTANAVSLPVKSFDELDIFLDPSTYNYYNTSITHNNQAPRVIANYSTDIAKDYALGYLDNIATARRGGDNSPFFVGIAPIAPHFVSGPRGNATSNPDFFITYPPISAPRHATLFENATTPKGPSYNPDVPSGAGWIYDLPRFNDSVSAYNDNWYRQRLRSLQAVDELVDAVFQKLSDSGLDDNTYVIYTGDNGFSIGQHRRPPSKCGPMEEDIRVPFFVTGPGVRSGQVESTNSMVDAGTTIVSLAQADPGMELDGRVMEWGARNAKASDVGVANFQLAEYWNSPLLEGIYGARFLRDRTKFRALRLRENGTNYAYHVWCTGQRELYDMRNDSAQMNNLLSTTWSQGAFPSFNVSGSSPVALRLASRLDALLLNQKTCKGRDCRVSWPNLFPYGEVTSLQQALDTKYDVYFNRLPKLQFSDCHLGYRIATELPMWSTDMVYYAPKDVANSSYVRRAMQDTYLILVD